MKLGTKVIHVIIMTQDEENALYDAPAPRYVEGKKILFWNTSDGHNAMRLEGEDFGRTVVIEG